MATQQEQAEFLRRKVAEQQAGVARTHPATEGA